MQFENQTPPSRHVSAAVDQKQGIVSLQDRWWWLSILCYITASSLMATTVLNAQAMFRWPSVEPDIAKYTKIEECLAAVQMISMLADREIDRQDTIAFNAGRATDTLASSARAAAHRCAAKFTVQHLIAGDTVHFNKMNNAYALLLLAGRDADARTLAENWLRTIRPEQDTLRMLVLTVLITESLASRPARLSDAWSRIQGLDETIIKRFWSTVVGTTYHVMIKSLRAGDTVLATQAARLLSRTPEIVGPEITQSNGWKDRTFGRGALVLEAQRFLKWNELLDSLRQGTMAYNAYMTHLRARAALPPTEPRMISPIEANYWFPAKVPRPEQGAVSIILTPYRNDCGSCLGSVRMIQRLHGRFPDVQFTLLARTRGFQGLVVEPPTPALEAMLIDSVYRKVQQLPATLAVFETPFWRLPEPDRRRINEEGPNEATFPTLEPRAWIYLIDRNGQIIWNGSWHTSNERQMGQMLDALLQAPKKPGIP